LREETYTLLDILKEINMTPIIPTLIIILLPLLPIPFIQPTKPLIPFCLRLNNSFPLPFALGSRGRREIEIQPFSLFTFLLLLSCFFLSMFF